MSPADVDVIGYVASIHDVGMGGSRPRPRIRAGSTKQRRSRDRAPEVSIEIRAPARIPGRRAGLHPGTPRTLGRHRLPARADWRLDPARQPDPGRRGRLGEHDHAAALPGAPGRGRRRRRTAPGMRRQFDHEVVEAFLKSAGAGRGTRAGRLRKGNWHSRSQPARPIPGTYANRQAPAVLFSTADHGTDRLRR